MAKCQKCGKSVYPMDPQIKLDGDLYHQSCARCSECQCKITLSNFTKADGNLLCKIHYMQKFKESGGKYSGGAKYKQFIRKDTVGGAIEGESARREMTVSTPV